MDNKKTMQMINDAQSGIKGAVDILFNENIGLIKKATYSIINRQSIKCDDYFQEASIAFINCVNKFNTKKQNAFTAYVWQSITRRLNYYRNFIDRLVQVSQDQNYKQMQIYIDMVNAGKTELEIAGVINSTITRVRTIKKKLLAYGDNTTLEDEENNLFYSDSYNLDTDYNKIKEAIKGLSDNQKEVIKLRYFTEKDKVIPKLHISKKLNVSITSVADREKLAIKYIQKKLKIKIANE